ncbi:MAG: T9SS type A sorting domain-containing protein [Bacteroidia bacterium]
MKRILLFAVAAMFTASLAFAQDVGVTSLLPTGPTLKKGVPTRLQFYITNLGSTAISQGTQIAVNFSVEGTAGTVSNIPAPSTLDPGDSLLISLTALRSFDNSPLGPIQFCAWTQFSGDIDINNDTTCTTYQLITYKRDVGVSAITVPPENSTIDMGVPTQFSFTLNNYSDSVIEEGITIPIQVRVGSGSPLNLTYTLENDLAANSDRTISTGGLTINAPHGNIEICISTNWGTNVDDFTGNDQDCNDYDFNTSIVENNFNGAVTVQPNPFHNQTQITYSLNTSSEVVLKVYDMNGKEITTLVNEKQPAGLHAADFNATGLEKGIYIYRLQAGEMAKTGKLVLE